MPAGESSVQAVARALKPASFSGACGRKGNLKVLSESARLARHFTSRGRDGARSLRSLAFEVNSFVRAFTAGSTPQHVAAAR